MKKLLAFVVILAVVLSASVSLSAVRQSVSIERWTKTAKVGGKHIFLYDDTLTERIAADGTKTARWTQYGNIGGKLALVYDQERVVPPPAKVKTEKNRRAKKLAKVKVVVAKGAPKERAGVVKYANHKVVKVVKGETLSGLAKKFGVSTEELQNSNRGLIGDDPDHIEAGWKLKIPDKNSAVASIVSHPHATSPV